MSSNQITSQITKENAAKVIANLSKGWKVDEHIAWIIFKNMFEGKSFEVNYVQNVCDFYAAALWNMGAIS
jgi:aromatic ring-opening dioxygenase catalytic subunit (LigB family)